MTPLPLTVTTGLSTGPNSPDYVDLGSKEKMQEVTNNKIPTGSSAGKGVILAKDSLDVPLETAFGIHNESTNTSRPTLTPLFRTRYVDVTNQEPLGIPEYEELRNSLPAELRLKLEKDEKLPFRERDPDLIAFDNSLKFEAMRRAIIKQLGGAETGTILNTNFQEMPEAAKQHLIGWSSQIVHHLENYLTYIGPNDPSYDLFLNAANQMKETLHQLKK